MIHYTCFLPLTFIFVNNSFIQLFPFFSSKDKKLLEDLLSTLSHLLPDTRYAVAHVIIILNVFYQWTFIKPSPSPSVYSLPLACMRFVNDPLPSRD